MKTAPSALRWRGFVLPSFGMYYKRLKAESEAQRGKPQGTRESEILSSMQGFVLLV